MVTWYFPGSTMPPGSRRICGTCGQVQESNTESPGRTSRGSAVTDTAIGVWAKRAASGRNRSILGVYASVPQVGEPEPYAEVRAFVAFGEMLQGRGTEDGHAGAFIHGGVAARDLHPHAVKTSVLGDAEVDLNPALAAGHAVPVG